MESWFKRLATVFRAPRAVIGSADGDMSTSPGDISMTAARQVGVLHGIAHRGTLALFSCSLG